MPSYSTVTSSNSASTHSQTPVAIFVGGTAGIGQASAQAFAKYTKGNAHIIIIGRNEQAALTTIATFPKHPSSIYEFVSCDVTIMSNISSVVQTLTARAENPISKVNYLVLSAGFLAFDGRQNTSEGIDKKMAVDFYSRFKFVQGLLPLLNKAKDVGEEARVLMILAAGQGTSIDDQLRTGDFGLEAPGAYGPLTCMNVVGTYKGLMIEELASRNPRVSFTHIFPGPINTGILSGSTKWYLRILGYLLSPFLSSAQTAAEYMLYPLLSPSFSSGAYHLGPSADPIPPNKLFITEEGKEKIYAHLVNVTEKW